MNPEEVLTTCQLAKRLDRPGGAARAHRATIHRWITRGVTVRGSVIRLRADRVGSRWLVLWSDWLTFRRDCASAAGMAPAVESPAERSKRVARAQQRLSELLGKAGQS